MSVTHHAYNLVKLPGCGGTITIHGQVQEALRAVELAYKSAAAATSTEEDEEEPLEKPSKKKQLFVQEKTATKKVSLDDGSSGASVNIGASLPPK